MEGKIIRSAHDNRIDGYCTICGDKKVIVVIGDEKTKWDKPDKVGLCGCCFATLKEEMISFDDFF